MDANFTLEKAITMARQSESVKSQQATVRGEMPQETLVDAITGPSRNMLRQGTSKNSVTQPIRSDKSCCSRCGQLGHHSYLQCSAKDVVCHNCGKTGHFKLMCRSRPRALHLVESGKRLPTTETTDDDDNFLGAIYASDDVSAVDSFNSKWQKTLTLNKRYLTFKVDTGANVTVIPSTNYSVQHDGQLQPLTRKLMGAGQHTLQVEGQFRGCLLYQDKEIYQDIFVVQGLAKPLLGRPAIDALQMVSMVEPVRVATPITAQVHPVVQNFP